MSTAVLFDYWRSSASYRVRIALNWKRVAFESVPVDLSDGAQCSAAHLKRNPQGFLPVLEIDGLRLTQSLSILEYLEETRPSPALLPKESAARQRVRALAQVVAADIHPICNPSVVKVALAGSLGDDDGRARWMRHFIARGFAALETLLREPETGCFCQGDSVSLADLCLVPQVYNAKRWGLDMTPYPTIRRINANCLKRTAFKNARPEAAVR